MYALTRRRILIIGAVVAALLLAAGAWLATTNRSATAKSSPVADPSPNAPTPESGLGEPVMKLPGDRTVMIVAPPTSTGAERILTVHPDTHGVDFALSQPDEEYNLISGSQVWLGLNPVGPPEDGNYQLVSVRDTEGGDAFCLSMNSAGQISEEGCEDVERPGELIIGPDVWHFENHGQTWDIMGSSGYLQAHERQAGVPEQRFVPTDQKFTVIAAPVRLSS